MVDEQHATDAKKIRQTLFKCFVFGPGSADRIGFREGLETAEEVEELYFDLILTRVARNAPQPVNFTALSMMAAGRTDQAERLRQQYTALPK